MGNDPGPPQATTLGDVNNPTQPVAPTEATWAYTEDYVPVTDAVRAARDEAIVAEDVPISTGVVAALTTIIKAMGAKAVVEVGTQHGASGMTFLQAMGDDGILTSIDAEADYQVGARRVFMEAGYPTSRFRLIAGSPIEVLPKLRDGAYDVVFINGDELEYVEYVAAAGRLLRDGGLLIVHDALWFNRVPDEADESDQAIIIREALEAVTNSESYAQSLLPVGNGLLLAAKL